MKLFQQGKTVHTLAQFLCVGRRQAAKHVISETWNHQRRECRSRKNVESADTYEKHFYVATFPAWNCKI